MPELFDQIGVYAVSGEGQAHHIHKSHSKNPAISANLRSICILDGDSSKSEDIPAGIMKLPGRKPETEVFDFVRNGIEMLSMQLAAGLHLSTEKEERVKSAVKGVAISNRDPHLLFNQVGRQVGLIPEKIVSSACIGLWISGNDAAAVSVSDFVKEHAVLAMSNE